MAPTSSTILLMGVGLRGATNEENTKLTGISYDERTLWPKASHLHHRAWKIPTRLSSAPLAIRSLPRRRERGRTDSD